MSGTTDSINCPICGNEMEVYADWKPIDYSSGNCMYCGFTYYPKVEQMGLKEINQLRAGFNENNNHLPEVDLLKPLKQKDLNKYKEEIKNFW